MTDLTTLEMIVLGSARGGAKRPQPLQLDYVRELNGGDIELLKNPPALGAVPNYSKILRHSHHMAARMFAEGAKPGQVSLCTGYAPSTVSRLQNDPAFKELIAYYKEQADGQYLEVHDRLASLGLSMVDELQNRLEETPQDFTNKQLLEGAVALLDRSVTRDAQPKSPGSVVVNVNLVKPATRTQGPVLDLDHTEVK